MLGGGRSAVGLVGLRVVLVFVGVIGVVIAREVEGSWKGHHLHSHFRPYRVELACESRETITRNYVTDCREEVTAKPRRTTDP